MRNLQRQPQVIQIIINPPANQRQMRRSRKAHPRGHAFGTKVGEAFERRSEYRNERSHREHACSCGANRSG